MAACWNTLGDKEHHEPIIHMAMPLHMCVVAFFVFIPDYIISSYRNSFGLEPQTTLQHSNNEKKNGTTAPISIRMWDICGHLVGWAVVACTLVYGVKSHPFLLADNRFV